MDICVEFVGTVRLVEVECMSRSVGEGERGEGRGDSSNPTITGHYWVEGTTPTQPLLALTEERRKLQPNHH